MSKKRQGRVGSSFSGYLKQEGTYEETSASAIKRALAWQLEQAMSQDSILRTTRFNSTPFSKPRVRSGARSGWNRCSS
jgi:hypothetical protein